MTTIEKLYEDARAQLAGVELPGCWAVEYTLTASRPHEPCVRFSRVFEDEEYEVSFLLPLPELAEAVRSAFESNEVFVRARRAARQGA